MIAASSNPLPSGASGVRCAEMSATSKRIRHAALASVAAFLASNAAVVVTATLVATSATAAETKAPSTEVLRDSKFDNGVVAVVDGDPITLRELKKYGQNSAAFLPPEVRNDYRELLDSLIEHKLLRSEFEKNGITAPDEMVDRYIASVLEDSHQTKAQLEADIARAGLTWKDYYERMREEVQRIQLMNLLIRSRVNVPEEEVRRKWESDPQFMQDEKLEVAAIFLPVTSGADAASALEKANEVRKEAKSDFEDAAKKYSQGPGASEGGVLGDFTRGTMAPHFEKALEGLSKGQVSEPVPGPGGFYIVKLVDVKKSDRKAFDEVKEELGNKLYEQRLSERYRKWVNEDLRKDHRIDNLVDSLALIAAGATPAPPTMAQPKAE